MASASNLAIRLEEDDWVVLEAPPDIDPGMWRVVKAFWNPEGQSADEKSALVPLADFVDRMTWLPHVWKARGGTYELDGQTLDAIRRVKNDGNQFRELAQSNPKRHQGAEAQVPHLKSTRRLKPRQSENVMYLLDMKNGANFSVPGAGKTLTALAVWQILRKAGSVDKMLVVCPKSSFEAWESESTESFDDPPITEIYEGEIFASNPDIAIVNFEQLENTSRVSFLKHWLVKNRGCLVIDEAHRIKAGRRSVRWNAVKSLGSAAVRVDILTGTPMPQGPKDLTALFSASWRLLTSAELNERYLPTLRRNTAFVRTTKTELELPEPTLRTVSRPVSELHSAILSALQDRYLGSNFLSSSDGRNLAKRGKAVMTMLAASTNPSLLVSKDFTEIEMGLAWPPKLVSQDQTLVDLINDYLKYEIPWKFEYVAKRASQLARNGEKLLVWSTFVGNLGALRAVLKKFSPALVHGTMSQDARETELRRFREDSGCSVLISNPQTLGEGISLHQVCHSEIFVDRSYNAGLYLQAVDRIHRLGLKSDQETTIEVLVSKGTIDERVSARLDTKIRALAKFLDDENLTTTAIPQGDELAPNEVLGLDEEDFADIAAHWGMSGD